MADEIVREGGRTALAGYMYQFIGVLALKALATDPTPDEQLPPRFEELVNLVREGQLYHEYFDEDAVVELPQSDSASNWILIQFKFSSQNPPETIGPKEYGGILDRLRASATRLACVNDPETQYWLMTNREYGPQTRNIVANAAASPRLTVDQRSIAVKLQKHDLMSLQDWKNHLKHFAKGVGCTQDEVDRGIQVLIGMMIERTTARDDQLLTVGDLMKAFTTFDSAEHLTRVKLASFSQSELDIVKPHLGIPHYPIRRKILDKISDSLKKEFQSIVILKGDGGNGKSVALWHWAMERAALAGDPESSFIVISYVNWLDEHYVAKMISKAANLSAHIGRCNENNAAALSRLETATPRLTNPRFCIGIDAVDDAIVDGDKARVLDELLLWCWEQGQEAYGSSSPPRLALILTCRDESEHTILTARLKLDRDSTVAHARPAVIPVPEFDDDDMMQALEHMPAAIAGRLKSALQTDVSVEQDYASREAPTRYEGDVLAPIERVSDYVLHALRHPAMWRSFIAVVDIQTQNEILTGDRASLHRLSSIFLEWFYQKLLLRRNAAPFDRDNLQTAMALIAAQSDEEKQDRASWYTVAERFFGVQAYRLLNEARSAGLIEIDGNKWYWRHSFVREYLITLPEVVGAS